MLDVVILAAGQGTRMKSNLPKVLHPLGGKPLVLYSVEAGAVVSERPPVLVIGHGGDAVREAVGDRARYLVQNEQLGTGHAVIQTRATLRSASQHVIVTYADMPLLRAESLRALYDAQCNHSGPFSMLTVITDQPRGFGRIVRGASGTIQAIVEESVASPEQLAIPEVNPGVYCFNADWLWTHLDQIEKSPKGEYFLTDLVEIAIREGSSVNAIQMTDPVEALGINTRVHLAEAEAALRSRTNSDLMLSGVTMLDPATTYIEPEVSIGQDTVIHPNTTIRGETRIGSGCEIGPNTIIESCTIGNNCAVLSSVLESAVMEDHAEIGPFGHLRKGAYLEEGVHMGNFGEVKNSRLHKGVKMGHFSYVGDGDIGEETNIGAGTITCNFDGVNKHKTMIGKNVFIGSDTMLVAPLTLGNGARTGAGSVVTHDVPDNTLVFGAPARPRPPKSNEASGEG